MWLCIRYAGPEDAKTWIEPDRFAAIARHDAEAGAGDAPTFLKDRSVVWLDEGGWSVFWVVTPVCVGSAADIAMALRDKAQGAR